MVNRKIWLAEQVGKNEATVSRWCSNKCNPLDMLVKIAELLNVDPRDLLIHKITIIIKIQLMSSEKCTTIFYANTGVKSLLSVLALLIDKYTNQEIGYDPFQVMVYSVARRILKS